jgi:hypothetical protein
MKKMNYRGQDENSQSIFEFEGGNSQLESTYNPSQIFFAGSQFFLYENEYDGTVGIDPVASCDTSPAEYFLNRIVKYKAKNDFPSTEDRSYSAWFNLKDANTPKIKILNFNLDIYSREILLNLDRASLFFVGDNVTLTRTSSSNFNVFGKVSSIISQTSIKITVDQEILDYVKGNFSTWTSFTDLQVQRTFSRVFLNSIKDQKGIKIELFENRHFKLTLNDKYTYFSIPGNSLAIEIGKWHGIFVNFSNTFKQLTLNIWKMQWDPIAKIPATTDMKLIFNKTLVLEKEDRSSDCQYFLEPGFFDLTNIRLFNKVAETDKQVLILNQNIVKDAHLAIIIDNALPQSKLPYIGYTR